MKPNCFFLRLDRSKLKNGYYRVQMGLAQDILSSVLLLREKMNRVLNPNRCLCFGFNWEFWLTVSEGLVT